VRALACLWLLACTGSKGKDDTFVNGGSEIASYAVSSDGHVKIPLAAGLSWGQPALGKDTTLIRVRAEAGPTFVIAAVVDDAPKPLTLATCAKAHGDRIAKAMSDAKVFVSPPMISEEKRKGESVPRLHYVVPLQAAPGVRGAATISWWTYFLDSSRCIAIGVTSVIHEKHDDPNSPDPEDMHRLERVFSLVMDATTIAN
jgi:hypothetical protein